MMIQLPAPRGHNPGDIVPTGVCAIFYMAWALVEKYGRHATDLLYDAFMHVERQLAAQQLAAQRGSAVSPHTRSSRVIPFKARQREVAR